MADREATGSAPEPSSTAAGPKLGSRIAITWVELTVAGLAGGVLGTSVGGPPGLVVYFATTLVSVAILLYNVDELVERRISQHVDGAATGEGRTPREGER